MKYDLFTAVNQVYSFLLCKTREKKKSSGNVEMIFRGHCIPNSFSCCF